MATGKQTVAKHRPKMKVSYSYGTRFDAVW
jgi:hypothetical protein